MTDTQQKTGRFGHDTNPAVDFELEVSALSMRLHDSLFGVALQGATEPEKLECGGNPPRLTEPTPRRLAAVMATAG